MFTQDQIQQLKNIIASRMTFYTANYITPDLLSKDEIQILAKAGVDVQAIKLKDTLIYQAFALGMISGAVPQSALNATSYEQFKAHLGSNEVIPLNSYERGVLRSIQTQSLSDIKGLSNRFEKFVDDQLITQSREHFERTIRSEMEAGISQKKSLRIISNEISKKLGDFSRDFDRIVQTQSAIATQEGRKAFIERNYGEDSLVYVDVYGGACKICIKDYLTSGLGSKPKVFKLNQLPPSSVNYGKKQKDWIVTQPPHHSFCRCHMNYLPNGYVWDEDNKKFIPGKIVNKIPRKSKVKVTFNGKQYSV